MTRPRTHTLVALPAQTRPETGTLSSVVAANAQANIFRLVASCRDRGGAASLLSSLDNVGATILRSDQCAADPRGGDMLLRADFHISDPTNGLSDLMQDIAEIDDLAGIDWQVIDISKRKRVAFYVSQHDHCLMYLLWRWRRGELDMDVVAVVSDRTDLEDEVERFGIPYHHIPTKPEEEEGAERAQLDLLCGNVDLVVMARYAPPLSRSFLVNVGVPVINIHRAALPAFPGAAADDCAFELGAKLIGATAYYAAGTSDRGPIIEQDVVRLTQSDDAAAHEQIGAEIERLVLGQAVLWHLQDRVMVHKHRTIVF